MNGDYAKYLIFSTNQKRICQVIKIRVRFQTLGYNAKELGLVGPFGD